MSPTAPYQESEDHVPNPLYQTGFVDTTGTSGDLGGRIQNISPVFAQAKADAFQNAVDAVDDPDRDESEVVVFHEGEGDQPSRDESIEKLRQAADDAANDPQLANPADTPAAREAAEAQGDDNGDGDDGDGDGEVGDFPADTDSKAKWTEYNNANELGVDQSLKKDDYVAAVKAAKAEKDSAQK